MKFRERQQKKTGEEVVTRRGKKSGKCSTSRDIGKGGEEV